MIALDTDALVWWAAGDSQLSRPAREAIEAEVQDGEILISAVSAWEVAMRFKAGRPALTMDAEPRIGPDNQTADHRQRLGLSIPVVCPALP